MFQRQLRTMQVAATLGRWSPITVRQIARNQVLLAGAALSNGLVIRYGWPIAVAQLLWGLVALKHGAGLAWVLGKIDGLRMFAAYRRAEGDAIAPVLGSSENEARGAAAANRVGLVLAPVFRADLSAMAGMS